MPLFYQHNINGQTRLAIWKIEEEEAFFTSNVSVQRTISHPHKRLQHLAGRYLLQHLFPDFPSWLIQIADTRKPFLEGEPYRFSISHSDDYAAAIVSTDCNVGIDVELPSQKIHAIRNKFMLPQDVTRLFGTGIGGERMDAEPGLLPLTIAWSAKEAVFKWYGKGEVDFREDIRFDEWLHEPDHGMLKGSFRKEEAVGIEVGYKLFDPLVLAWIAGHAPRHT